MKTDKQAEDLERDTIQWDVRLQYSTEEINFLKQLLTSDIFGDDLPQLSRNLSTFERELEELKQKKIGLQVALHNHRNDLLGMRECEDISCEIFYVDQHQELITKIQQHFSNFQELKSKIYRFISPKLKIPLEQN